MPVSLTLFDDYIIFDGLESVTLRAFVPGSDSTEDTTLTNCVLRRPVGSFGKGRTGTVDGGQSQGRYELAAMTWYLPHAFVSGQPELGSKIIDSDSVQWTITDVQRSVLHNQWKCACVNLAIRGGLTSKITIQRATIGKGTQGQQTLTWADWQVDLAARFQQNSVSLSETDNRRESIGRYTAYVEERLNFDTFSRWRVVYLGDAYNVISVSKPQEIDGFTEIYCDESLSPL